VLASGAGFAAASILAVNVATGGPVSAVLERADGRAFTGLYADRVGVMLLLLIFGVSTVAQAYARRYLRGEAQARRFFRAAGVLTSATAAITTAATLVGLAIAWSAAGIALCFLLGTYRELPAARSGMRRTAGAVATSDAALWAAVLISTTQWGDLDLRRLGDHLAGVQRTDQELLTVVACLLVVAALARSAQAPWHRWLPTTLAAPTPASALLHAGVVNAGGVLLVRTSAVFGASGVATHLAFAAAAFTTVYAAMLMATRPDVKGMLAQSTVAQMGFMIMTCALGAFGAATMHLVAHGLYKASLFLGSGHAVRRLVHHAAGPPRRQLGTGTAVAISIAALIIPAATLTTAVLVLHPHVDGHAGGGGLLVLAWLSAAWMCWAWLRRHPSTVGGLAALAGTFAVSWLYVAVVRGVTGFLAPALADAGTATVTPWALGVVIVLLAALTMIRVMPPIGWLRPLHLACYVHAASAAHVARDTWYRSRPIRLSRSAHPEGARQ
jgi:NAD(P)H-quinone oxidoreductase subunit 5